MTGPLHCERCGKMANYSLGRVIRRLGLRNIDDGAGHPANDHYAPQRFSLHQVLCDAGGEEVCPIHNDTPQLLRAGVRIGNNAEILGKSGASNQVVHLALLGNDVGDGVINESGSDTSA